MSYHSFRSSTARAKKKRKKKRENTLNVIRHHYLHSIQIPLWIQIYHHRSNCSTDSMRTARTHTFICMKYDIDASICIICWNASHSIVDGLHFRWSFRFFISSCKRERRGRSEKEREKKESVNWAKMEINLDNDPPMVEHHTCIDGV